MLKRLLPFLLASVVIGAWLPARAASMELHSFSFPERRPVYVQMMPRTGAPNAVIRAEVTYKKGQGRVELSYENLKPAILFGGDVTCYVLWAVSRDGHAENLGELLTRKASGRLTFSTGKKEFALIVTAEAFYLAGAPSDLVMFNNAPRFEEPDPSSPFAFAGFVPAPAHGMSDISRIRWDSKIPLELLQARKAYELAGRHEARTHAPRAYSEAGTALKIADEIAEQAPGKRELRDFARRAVALSNEAISMSMHRIEAIELDEQIEQRRAEMARMEQRAEQAEATAQEAQRVSAEVAREADRIRAEKQRMMDETTALSREKTVLEGVMVEMRQEQVALQNEFHRLRREKTALEAEARGLQQEKVELERASARLKREKSELNGRLQSALSHVAETRNSVNGFVINLPDILFDVGESTLKPEAELVLAKLAGILLITPDQQAVIEGHTDATGTAEFNLDLSQRRSETVRNLLHSQGISQQRLTALGYGMAKPVANNSTADGRKRNRRVEILIHEQNQATASSTGRAETGVAIPASENNR
jgi:outer membrane protein OmpA-like peptidoglycan-associated protein